MTPIYQLAEFVAHLATAFGVPLALLAYWKAKTQERHDREREQLERERELRDRDYAAYDALDEKYLGYLRMCIEMPQLDLYYLPLEHEPTLAPPEEVQQLALCEIIIALLERAFVLYGDQATKIKKARWEEWNEYMGEWARQPTFRKLWHRLGSGFDEDFVRHMNAIIMKHPEPPRRPKAMPRSEGV